MVGTAGRTDHDELALVEELFPSLHRLATVVAPWDLEADDLPRDALVAVLQRRSLNEIDHPAAYLRKVMVNLAAGHSRRMGASKRSLERSSLSMDRDSNQPSYTTDMAELERLRPAARPVIAYKADGDIWIMNNDGTNKIQVTNNSSGDAASPSWRPR